MNILWITDARLDIGLAKTSRLEMVKNLLKSGNEICLIASSYWGKKDTFGFNNNIIKYLPEINRFYLSIVTFQISVFFYTMYYLISNKPDIILIQGFPGLSLIPFASLSKIKIIKCKFVLDIRTVPVEFTGFKRKFKDFEFRIALLIAKYLFDGITVITPEMKKLVQKKFRIKEEIISVWSSGVSLSLFNPSILNKSQIKPESKEKFIVLYHGVLTRNRGLQETIKAIKILVRKYPNIYFYILGDGSAKVELNELIKKYNINFNVIVKNSIPYEKVPQYIAIADVGILPFPDITWWRVSCPLKLMEYLAMEKPVIVTDIKAHREVLSQNPCGIFIKSNRPIDIAKGILTTYKNRHKIFEWGKQGRKIVEKRFTWDSQSQSLNNFLISITKREIKI